VSKSREVEIACEVRAETAKAYLIYDGKIEVWVPKSQVTDYSEEKGKITSIFLSEWLATEKGLL
jgi:hypothetical protein